MAKTPSKQSAAQASAQDSTSAPEGASNAISLDPASNATPDVTAPSASPKSGTAAASASQVQSTTRATSAEVPISMLYDLSLPVSIELGRTSMTVQDILRLGRNSVIQLDRLAGEPVDVYVSDRRFAEGEVVIVGETFGVRITRLVSNSTPSSDELVS